jgi:aspartyl/asparaginyl-tRNA synthetase
MKDSNLLKIAISFSLIGILAILLVSEFTPLPNTKISELQLKALNQKVKVYGQITSITETDKIFLLNLKDQTGEITILGFKDKNITLQKNQFIEVQGTLTEYKDRLEINTDLIKK